MCKFKSASYRRGLIVESTDASGKLVELPVAKARAVGQRINAGLDKYLQAMEAEITASVQAFADQSQGSKPGRYVDFSTLRINSNPDAMTVSARFDPGLILDFPWFKLTGKNAEFSIRSCLTVCVGGMKSKIWTRSVINEINGGRRVSLEDLADVHDLSRLLCKRMNDKIRQMYEVELSAVTEIPISLSGYGTVHLFAVDCEGPNVSVALEKLCDNFKYGKGAKNSIQNEEISEALQNLTHISMPKAGQSAIETKEFRLSDQAAFFPFRGTNGAGSIFVSVTQDRDAYFSGLVNADHCVRPEDYPFDRSYPNGVGTTAEVASFLAGAF